MSEPDAVVVHTATTPAEAKVFVAMLQAEGIPAYVEGDSLADEVAASRRLMNLQGVRVVVPPSARQRAVEILAEARVDEVELEAQALAAGPPPEVGAPRPAAAAARGSRPAGRGAVLWAIGASVSTLVFFALWVMQQDERAAMRDYFDRKWEQMPFGDVDHKPGDWDRQPIADGIRWVDHEGKVMRERFDRDRDGRYEEKRDYDRDGHLHQIVHFDGAGHETSVELFRDGLREVLHMNAEGRTKDLTLFDADGKQLKQQRWDGANGWVDVPTGR